MSHTEILRLGNEALESQVSMEAVCRDTLSLEQIADRLEMLIEPTLDRQVPQDALALSYESIVGLGVDNPYHDKEADVVSLEGKVWDTIKKIWQAIKNAVKRFINHLVDYITKFFSGVDKAIKETEKLQRVITSLSKGDKQSSDKQVSFDDGLRIGIDGKVDIKLLMDRLEKEFTVMSNIKKTYMNQYGSLLRDLPAYTLDIVSQDSGKRKIDDKEFQRRIEKDNDVIRELYGEVKDNRELPAGKQFVIDRQTDDRDLVGLYTLEVRDFPRAHLFKGKMVDVADLSTLSKLLEHARLHLESIQAEKREISSLKDTLRNVTDKIDETLDDREDYYLRTRKDKKLMVEIVDKTRLNYLTRLNKLSMYQYHVMRGIIGYVHVCAKSY